MSRLPIEAASRNMSACSAQAMSQVGCRLMVASSANTSRPRAPAACGDIARALATKAAMSSGGRRPRSGNGLPDELARRGYVALRFRFGGFAGHERSPIAASSMWDRIAGRQCTGRCIGPDPAARLTLAVSWSPTAVGWLVAGELRDRSRIGHERIRRLGRATGCSSAAVGIAEELVEHASGSTTSPRPARYRACRCAGSRCPRP